MSPVVVECLAVALGGGLGALTRYGVQHLGIFDDDKYYYTVGINISGCIAIGVIAALFQHYGVARIWHLLLVTGFMGGYTTYSAFALDAIQEWMAGHHGITVFYILVTLVGGIGGAALGLYLTRKALQML